MPNEVLIPDAAVKAIQDSVKTEVVEIGGLKFVTRQVYRPPSDSLPETLIIHTLTGLIKFIEHERNISDIDSIHVVDHKTVDVQGALEGHTRERPLYAQAQLVGASVFNFGHYHEVDDFIVKLRTCFALSPDVERILAIVGNLTDEEIRTAVDDGVTQKVTTRKGISLGEEVKVPNPVRLAPFRTFAEIQQPESFFILRLHRRDDKLPTVALFEVGDQKWQLEAIQKIKDFIVDEIDDIPVIA